MARCHAPPSILLCRHITAGCLALFFFLLSAEAVHAAEPVLQLRYGGNQVRLSPSDFAKLKPTEVGASDHERPHRYRGVAVRDLLQLVDAPLGDKLRRPTLAHVVLIKGADGYVCAFALAEFEQGFTDRTIILASHDEGMPLSADLGPWRLVAPKDTRLARWVRQVVSLEVISIENGTGGNGTGAPAKAATEAKEHRKFVPVK